MNTLILASVLFTSPQDVQSLLPWSYDSLVRNVSVSVRESTVAKVILVSGEIKKGGNTCEAAQGKTQFDSRIEGDVMFVSPKKLLSPMVRQVCPLYYEPVFEKTTFELEFSESVSKIVFENYREWGHENSVDFSSVLTGESIQ